MKSKQITGIEPSRFHFQRIRVFYKIFYYAVRRLFSPIVKIAVEGRENVPRRGSILVLSNHVGYYDPFVLIMALGRPIHFMATQTVFQKKLLLMLVLFFGAVPKMKFLPDVRAIFKLMDWSSLGAAIGLFPEGKRSWDGRANEILPGVGKLVKLLRVPVVTVRIVNADRLSPRWALYQRRGRISVSIDPPRYLHRIKNPSDIERQISHDTRVDVENCRRDPVYGKNYAVGISNVLFLCPACLSMESLVEDKNVVRCGRCLRGWKVGSDNHLTSLETSERVSLVRLLDGMYQQLDQCGWTENAARFAKDGVVLESRIVHPYETVGNRRFDLGEGRIQLTKDSFSFLGRSPKAFPLSELLVATVDIVHDLQFRTKHALIEINMTDESVVKWEMFVNHWIKAGTM